MSRITFCFAVFLCLLPTVTIAEPDPTIPAVKGYITRAASPTDFDVNGFHIVCNDQTEFASTNDGKTFIVHPAKAHYLGQGVTVFGTKNNKSHTIDANKIIVTEQQQTDLSGKGIIDLLLPGDNPKTGERVFRADGYRILINPKAHITLGEGLASLSAVGTNVWIRYSGKLQPDGTLIADSADFIPNIIPDGENKLRTNNEYSPRAIDQKDKQSDLSKFFLGTNVKKIPPYKDPVMQARVDRIGASVIPAYQRALPASDPTKIYFRFQVIDETKWQDAITLPSGIILVPRQVVERMQNDSQLATVLADNIATAIEKQSYRAVPAYRTMAASQLASDVGGFFVPGVGVATLAVNYKASKIMLRHAEEQSGRISLGYLHDAGYDVREAPKAWWLLGSKKPKNLNDINLPDRAAYLYSVLGQSWRTVQ